MIHSTSSATKLGVALVALFALPAALVPQADASTPLSTLSTTNSTPIAQNTGMSLAKRLSQVGNVYADGNGEIVMFSLNGDAHVLSVAGTGEPFSTFVMGDDVDDYDTLAGCPLNSTGSWSECDLAYGETLLTSLEALIANPPDPTLDTSLGAFRTDCDIDNLSLATWCEITWLPGEGDQCHVDDPVIGNWQVC